MTEKAPETGDRPAPQGAPPILVDTSTDPQPAGAQGDRRVEGAVFLVHDEQRATPTAGDYRAAGYLVPDHDGGPVPDAETPGLVYADQRVAGMVTLVDTPPTLPLPAPTKEAQPAPSPLAASEVPGPAAAEPAAAAPAAPPGGEEEGDSPPRRRGRG